MPHNPHDPETKAAYKALIKEAGDQYQSTLDAGLKVDFIHGEDPYGNPRNAILDVTHNNHLSVFPTTEGFGSGSPVDVAGNPLLAPTRFKIGDKVMLATTSSVQCITATATSPTASASRRLAKRTPGARTCRCTPRLRAGPLPARTAARLAVRAMGPSVEETRTDAHERQEACYDQFE
ncbi:hypothetical protein QN397_23695 [Variovorax sp. RTB1]|uniref:hypothetical protein n=1 Tax=Variovorax sp. RTB1 TaxID=3048631 RepID=UPI002B222D31|nr:hypothetical protein [Variovorax sp. RTB1]MEB0114287.1 hypothetical protein [Variovorax sp. RTB1]